MTRISLSAAALALVAAGLASPALAAGYPNQPITLVVPFPPGGGNDQIGRLVGERLSAALKVPVVATRSNGRGSSRTSAYG